MSPTLVDGDYVLTIQPRSIRPGFIYVINHSDLGRIVKRCVSQTEGRYSFTGDNQSSTPDALLIGIEARRVIGRALIRIGKSGMKRL